MRFDGRSADHFLPGAWSGHGSALVHEGRGIDRDEETRFSIVVLTGEGVYEGLTAYLQMDWTEEPFVVEGAVFVGEAPHLLIRSFVPRSRPSTDGPARSPEAVVAAE